MEHLLQNPLNVTMLLMIGAGILICICAGLTEILDVYQKRSRERKELENWKRIKDAFDKENRF